MDQSPAACLASAHATDGVHGGATHVGGVGDLSFGVLLRTGAGRGGENLLPTCVLCHVNRSTQVLCPSRAGCRCPGCCMRRWSRPCGGGDWCGCGTAWCAAPWRPSNRC